MKLAYSIAAITAASASAAFAADNLFMDANTVRKFQQTLTNRGFPIAVDGHMGRNAGRG